MYDARSKEARSIGPTHQLWMNARPLDAFGRTNRGRELFYRISRPSRKVLGLSSLTPPPGHGTAVG